MNTEGLVLNELTERHNIINEHILYAEKLAAKFYGKRAHTQAEMDDLIGSAYLGLCDAASRYDLKKSDAFKTYSYFIILGTMYDYVQLNGGISRNSYKKLKADSDKKLEMMNTHNAQSLENLKSLIEDWGITVHYNRTTQDIEISYVDQPLQEEHASRSQISKMLRDALNTLEPVVKEVLEKRYFEEKSLVEISKEMPEFSKTYLCRIHQRGLDQLRDILTCKKLD